MFKTSITKEEINDLPLFKYGGKVEIAVGRDQIRKALNEICHHDLVGFDTESKPAYRKGQFNHVSLIQIATPDKVYLLKTLQAGVTDELKTFFSDPDIHKIGIAIDDDLFALKKRRPFKPAGFIDLNKVAVELGIQNIGARNLSALLLGVRISKSQQVSNWENETLTPKQIDYAATDAWICLEMYKRLEGWDMV